MKKVILKQKQRFKCQRDTGSTDIRIMAHKLIDFLPTINDDVKECGTQFSSRYRYVIAAVNNQVWAPDIALND